MSLPYEQMMALYEMMLLIRRFEERVAVEYRAGNIPGFVHLYIGEEAVAAGVCAHLEDADAVTSTHRGHGHALAKGMPPRALMAELFGRKTGCSGGRGGSMHLFDSSVTFMGTSGLVGPSIPTATGAAYTFKYREKPNVAVAFFGDGMVNNGAFHEGLNLAAVWALPVVFICENNMYATEMPFQNATLNTEIASRGAAYGIPGVTVDGMDVSAVYDAAGEAINRARSGGGPTLIAADTYRYVGHHEGDPGTEYRTAEEIENWKDNDPLSRLVERLIDEGMADSIDQAIRAIEDRVESQIAEAVAFAAESPFPEADSVEHGVFATSNLPPRQ